MVSDDSHLYMSTIALEKSGTVVWLLIQVTQAGAHSCRLSLVHLGEVVSDKSNDPNDSLQFDKG